MPREAWRTPSVLRNKAFKLNLTDSFSSACTFHMWVSLQVQWLHRESVEPVTVPLLTGELSVCQTVWVIHYRRKPLWFTETTVMDSCTQTLLLPAEVTFSTWRIVNSKLYTDTCFMSNGSQSYFLVNWSTTYTKHSHCHNILYHIWISELPPRTPRPTTHDPQPTTHNPRPTTHDPQLVAISRRLISGSWG